MLELQQRVIDRQIELFILEKSWKIAESIGSIKVEIGVSEEKLAELNYQKVSQSIVEKQRKLQS